MDILEFVDLVDQMRAAQMSYFSNRTKDNLMRAKSLERSVDQRVLEFKSPTLKL